MVQKKLGHTTITYRFRLYEKHQERFQATKRLYNLVVKHYYEILKERLGLLELSGHELLRELERMSVGTKEMKAACQEPEYPLVGMMKVPLYFRRAAINNAAGLMRRGMEQDGHHDTEKELFQLSPVYYKGMYRNWNQEEKSIELKLYDGEKWSWGKYRYTGRDLPENGVCQSPVLVVGKKDVQLHVPVELPVEDTRTIKERMQEEERILAVAFPGDDSMAIGAVLNRNGTLEATAFWKGGQQRKAVRNAYKKKIEMQKATGQSGRKYQEKTRNMNDFYAHQVSRRIVDYCIEQNIRVIAVPNYQRAIDFGDKQYLKTDNFEWIGRRIIQYLKYKAYAQGIVVSSVPMYHISDTCSICGAKVKRYNEGYVPGKGSYGGSLYNCPNGHQGNSGLNAARNVGKRFLSFYQL